MPATEFFDGAALTRPCILDGLGFVEDDHVPLQLLEPRQPEGHRVTGDDQVSAGERFGWGFARGGQFFGRRLSRMRVSHRERRRELLDFGLPVGDERRRDDQQAGLAIREWCFVGGVRGLRTAIPFEHQQQRQHLDGFAQAHVVGQTRAQAQLVHEPEPMRPLLLVWTQLRLQFRVRIRFGRRARLLHFVEQFPETLAGHHARPFHARCFRHRVVRAQSGKTRQQPQPLQQRHAAGTRCGLNFLPMAQDVLEFLLVHLDPFALQQHQAASGLQDGLQLRFGQRLAVER